MTNKITLVLAYAILGVMAFMVIASILDLQRGGSLDDLPAEAIKRAVNG